MRQPAKPKPPPPARNLATEQALCRAIREKKRVRFRYGGGERTFDPYVVRTAETGNVIVFGFQIRNSAKPLDPPEEHSFTVGKIKMLSQTDADFSVSPTFDFAKFREGVICCVTRG